MANCTNIIGTSAYDKFIEGVSQGKIKDHQPIPLDMFTENELYLLHTAGYIYLYQYKGKSCFRAVV